MESDVWDLVGRIILAGYHWGFIQGTYTLAKYAANDPEQLLSRWKLFRVLGIAMTGAVVVSGPFWHTSESSVAIKDMIFFFCLFFPPAITGAYKGFALAKQEQSL